MQNFGVTNKEHYGMLCYFLEWSILSDARQPEEMPFPFKYALTLPNCIARCLLRIKILIETFCPNIEDIYCPRVQKTISGLRALLKNVFP